MAVFMDLSIQSVEKKKLESIIETAAHLGYSAVAVNHVANFEKETKKEIAKPLCHEELFEGALPIVQGTTKPVKIVTRLTIVASDPSHCTEMRTTSQRTKLYDVVSVFPKTEKLFHTACLNLDVDLICINVTEKQPFYFKRAAVNAAISRGIYFELVYTPAIRDSTMRRYTISNALALMQSCKGKNIIISSGAEKPLELRGPYDIANLGLLFGLSEAGAKAAVSTNCRAVILHGATRKTAFGVIHTMPRDEQEDKREATAPASKRSRTEAV
ncbi:ribonuclease P protein subunit p30 [Protopterus annectens]|uniref:ribonuclease P protein subunit p30 n=1 Tax=Protopterus annectens TaxID=7888 RepID=UPI001CFADCE8|nr:ribonuclease P protein subunit p30 [Protopterus annectens]